MEIARLKQPDRVVEIPLSHGRVHALRAATPDLFAVTGSFRTSPSIDRGELLLQPLVAALTTCGSLRHDQFEMADLLESRGATLSIESELQRVTFSAQACSADLPLVVELLAECLREPRFDADNLITERARLIAELEYRAAEPTAMVADALSRALYPPSHPRHQTTLAEQVAQLECFTVDDVRRYHREHFGANDLCIVVVGDIDPWSAAAAFDQQLSSWLPRPLRTPDAATALPDSKQDIRIAAPGRENFDVVLGHRLDIRCDDPDYMALWMANHILGATFDSRLVTAVREQQGLTYSIRSQLSKPCREFDGHWQFNLSSSPDRLDAGLAATRAEITKFVDIGVSAEELAAKQIQAIGAFQIGLATLYGLSETMLFGAERGRGPDYIREFAGMIGGVTAVQLNRVIQDHLRPAELCVAIAGPFAHASITTDQ
jgi:zinc protease